MTNSLANYSDKSQVATNEQAFRAFIDTFQEINASLTSADVIMIKECISDDNIKVSELEHGLKQAYKDPKRYGKVEWNHIWKWIEIQRSEGSVKVDMRRFH